MRASHGVGKSHVCAGIVNWWFDVYDPSIGITSAPTKAQVEDVLWRQIRDQRPNGANLQPRAPRMESGTFHYAVGYTAADANAFQGRHEQRLLVIFDEAVGIDPQFFDAAEGMTTGPENRWLCIYNPTDLSSKMKAEEDSGGWYVIVISALEHPNIQAQLRGEPMPYPKAVSLEYVEDKLEKWCERLGPHDVPEETDVEFPPGSGTWYRPGPLFESRVLGRWPTLGIDTVWTEALWQKCLARTEIDPEGDLAVGCDVARFGDDATTLYARKGNALLAAESHNGWPTDRTAGRLKELCRELGATYQADPKRVPVYIDDDGIGGGVADQKGEFRFVRCNAQTAPHDPDGYPNRRSERWFGTAMRAKEGRIDATRIPAAMRDELKRQLLMPKYKLDAQGRRVVEPKSETKKRLKRSPDDADGFNLCYEAVPAGSSAVLRTPDAYFADRYGTDDPYGGEDY